ncbi:DUF3693 domain-containing protein [Xanthomonas vasicola]|uniref:DUF3693 domain-containing protein n=1 Tax=Xanthomonas vasicola TaxID=56459 RepID=UPI000F44EF94|nr:DUF3693 domain-containing protein [Xanthomonas vasicola]RNK79763.1 hypothetical protein C9392_15425 [Xanthomonas vasicola pv. vasculorum]RNL45831.1 hypothetical protein C9398_19580 [Xanthomonas vasicola pv. vasculorum]
MSATNELLDKVKEVCSFPSDMAIAEKLGINRQMLWKARHEDKPLSDERIAQLCAMAKLDGATWLARIHAERAATQVERALWKSVLDRLTPVTAVVGAMVLAIGMTPATGRTKTLEIQGLERPDFAYSVYYVKFLLRLLATAITRPWRRWPAEWRSAYA